jgi:acylphosphatase
MSEAPPPATVARMLAVEGRVQGVGYRDAMIDAAQAVCVQGTVRNGDDGRVLAQVQGTEEAVAAIIAWASRGPPLARVSSVEVEAAEPDSAHTTFRRIR